MAKVGYIDERGCTGSVEPGGQTSPYFLALALVLPADAIAPADASFLAWRRKYWPKSLRELDDGQVIRNEHKGSRMLRDYRQAWRSERHQSSDVERIGKAVQSLCDRLHALGGQFFIQALIKREGPHPGRRRLAHETYFRLGQRLELRGRHDGGPIAIILDHRSQTKERENTLRALHLLAEPPGSGLTPPIQEMDSAASGLLQATDVLTACCAAPALEMDFRAEIVRTNWTHEAHRHLGERLRQHFANLCPRGNAEVRIQGMNDDGRWNVGSGSHDL